MGSALPGLVLAGSRALSVHGHLGASQTPKKAQLGKQLKAIFGQSYCDNNEKKQVSTLQRSDLRSGFCYADQSQGLVCILRPGQHKQILCPDCPLLFFVGGPLEYGEGAQLPAEPGLCPSETSSSGCLSASRGRREVASDRCLAVVRKCLDSNYHSFPLRVAVSSDSLHCFTRNPSGSMSSPSLSILDRDLCSLRSEDEDPSLCLLATWAPWTGVPSVSVLLIWVVGF